MSSETEEMTRTFDIPRHLLDANKVPPPTTCELLFQTLQGRAVFVQLLSVVLFLLCAVVVFVACGWQDPFARSDHGETIAIVASNGPHSPHRLELRLCTIFGLMCLCEGVLQIFVGVSGFYPLQQPWMVVHVGEEDLVDRAVHVDVVDEAEEDLVLTESKGSGAEVYQKQAIQKNALRLGQKGRGSLRPRDEEYDFSNDPLTPLVRYTLRERLSFDHRERLSFHPAFRLSSWSSSGQSFDHFHQPNDCPLELQLERHSRDGLSFELEFHDNPLLFKEWSGERPICSAKINAVFWFAGLQTISFLRCWLAVCLKEDLAGGDGQGVFTVGGRFFKRSRSTFHGC